MAKLSVVGGTTGLRILVFAKDILSSTGAGDTGLTFSNITGYYVRAGSSAVAITMATQTVTGAYSSGGFVEIDATNMPGVYRFDVPDAVVADGVKDAVILLRGTGFVIDPIEFEITVTDNQSSTAAADALLDRANGVETGWTIRQILRVLSAVLGGKMSGGGTSTVVFRNVTDAKDRVTATVDSNGNRTALTIDAT